MTAVMTLSGRLWPLLAPRPDDVVWPDIAESLAKICRFGGHTRLHYSVAQHSVLVADLLPPALRAYGLLHDAHEAFLGDITRPMRMALAALGEGAALDELTRRADAAIHAAAGLPWPLSPADEAAVKAADTIALATEARDLMMGRQGFWDFLPPPHRRVITPAAWPKAMDLFNERLTRLGIPPAGGSAI